MQQPRLVKKSAELAEPRPPVRTNLVITEQAKEWLAARAQGNPRAEFEALFTK
jgi:hypothetical protein